jgi:hypothetical protein
MRIFEIDYASSMEHLAVSPSQLNRATVVGTVDQQPVYLIDNGNHSIAFFKLDQTVCSYVIISSQDHLGFHQLHRVENICGPKGSISALLAFLHWKFDIKFEIPAQEPLTWQGLQWLCKIISAGRGFVITDQFDNRLNADALSQEWMQAKNLGQVGQTAVRIHKVNFPRRVVETHSSLVPYARRFLYENDDI